MIIALAGRRVDAPNAPIERFPLRNLETVRQRVRDLLLSQAASALVSSAACGADLIAQSEAGKLGLRRRVVLPFARERFLESSVADRPGDWTASYHQVLEAVTSTGDLVVLKGTGSPSEAYAAANSRILEEAESLARRLHRRVLAVMIWDGSSRGEGDLTASFGEQARMRGIPVVEVSTL